MCTCIRLEKAPDVRMLLLPYAVICRSTAAELAVMATAMAMDRVAAAQFGAVAAQKLKSNGRVSREPI